MEDKKSLNDRKNYISKTRFDTEFQIYRALSKDFFTLVKTIYNLIPDTFYNSPDFKDVKEKDDCEKAQYGKALKAYEKAQDELYENAPFIDEKFFSKYSEILDLCNLQLEVFQMRWNSSYTALPDSEKWPKKEDKQRTKDILKKNNELIKEIREYLSTLDII